MSEPSEPVEQVEVAIVGAGFGGIAMASALRRAGREDFVVLERADDVGGTWRDNTYPGCACDVPSHLYSLSFAPNPDWSQAFSGQAEIRDYLRRTAEAEGLLPSIRFGQDVQAAEWDEASARWELEMASGARVRARVLVAAAGPLSDPALPAIPGLEEFRGPAFHSAQWRHDVDLAGTRVAVVGTGASAIQLVPHLQRTAAQVLLYQRTPAWVTPQRNRDVSRVERWLYRRLPVTQRIRRALAWGGRELLLPAFARNGAGMRLIERLARRHLRRQVPDPQLRAALTPSYRIGCKRILLSDDYFPAVSQPNVQLVPHALAEVRGSTLVAGDGSEHEADAVVFATGFHVTDSPLSRMVRGRGGQLLADVWRGSPQADRGTTVAGFPNLFLLLGPNTGLGHSSVVYMIESQVRYVLGALRAMDRAGAVAVEPRPEAQAADNARIQERMARTVWSTGGCSSWYQAADGANRTLWPGFTWTYRRAVARFDADRHVLVPAPVPAPAATMAECS